MSPTSTTRRKPCARARAIPSSASAGRCCGRASNRCRSIRPGWPRPLKSTRPAGPDDTATLTDAFTNIIEEILSVNTTFTAPTVAVNAFNRTQNLDDLFITVFGTPQPPSSGNKFHWPGNIKKYEINTDGMIVGPGEKEVVDKTTGFFSAKA